MNQCTYRIGCMSKDKLLPKNLEAMIKVIHDLSLSSQLSKIGYIVMITQIYILLI